MRKTVMPVLILIVVSFTSMSVYGQSKDAPPIPSREQVQQMLAERLGDNVDRTEIVLESDILDRYVGQYELVPNVIFTVKRKESQLSLQMTGQGAAEIYPESETEFFSRVVDAQILFKTDSKSRVNALVLRQKGMDQLARRIGGDADPIEEWFGHRVAGVDPAFLKNYVGSYQLAPGTIFTVTLEGQRLLAQLTGQPQHEVFPEGDHKFFYKIIDAQIMFEVEGEKPAQALILHQGGGQSPRAERIAE